MELAVLILYRFKVQDRSQPLAPYFFWGEHCKSDNIVIERNRPQLGCSGEGFYSGDAVILALICRTLLSSHWPIQDVILSHQIEHLSADPLGGRHSVSYSGRECDHLSAQAIS